MQGYMTILSEVWETGQFDDDVAENCPTHVFLQVGVGSFSGGLSGFLTNKMKKLQTDIKIITVEPRGAHCVFYSHQVGDGNLHS
jgi:diaminopropionate ammonia-lyase